MRLTLLGLAGAGLLAASSAQAAKISPLDLVNPIADYKIFVMQGAEKLAADTKAFTEAVKAGDLAAAQALYAPTRVSYEMIEPIAELFSDLDGSIDSRADDHEQKEADPAFTGFHRLEYGLFDRKSTDGLAPVADRLLADVRDLQSRIKGLTIPPGKMVGGAAALIEEVAATKISGEEDRYSHTDLWDFKANVDGAQTIVALLTPLLQKANPKLATRVQGNFATVDGVLAKYRTADGGFETYDKLTETDRKALQAAVTALAEDLSKLRGALGLS